MKQTIFTLFSILISCVCLSQHISIKITVTDSLTSKHLPYATVYLKKSGLGKSTNSLGKVELNINTENQRFDTLVCSYIGYQGREIPLDLSTSTSLEIRMTPLLTQLSEAVITYKKPLTSKQILKRTIKNTGDNYSNTPVNLLALYRETLKEKNHNIYLNEAYVNIHYSEYPQNKIDHKKWLYWYYDDTYAFEFEPSWFNEFPTHFNTDEDKVKLIEARTSENWSDINFDSPIAGGPLSMTGKDFIKYQYDFLNPDNFSKYNYTKKDNELINNHNCYVLDFYPKESNRKMSFDYSKKLKRSIYIGKIYIDIATFAVVKMEYQLAKNVDFGYYENHVPLDEIVAVDYQKIDSFWYLKKVSKSKIRSIIPRAAKSLELYQSTQELIITDVNTRDVIPITEDECWKHTRLTTLRNNESKYNASFWDNFEKYPSLPIEISNDLEKEKSLEEQFETRFKKIENLSVPKVKKVEFSFDYPFEKTKDDYQWFADSTNQTEFFNYLIEENHFADNYILPNRTYQKHYFEKLNNFYLEDTTTNTTHKKGDYIYDDDSSEHLILYEYTDSVNRIPIFNFTNFVDARENCYLLSVKPSKNKLGLTYTIDGGMTNTMLVIEKGNEKVVDRINNIYSYEWFSDSVLYYTQNNATKRADKLFKHDLINNKDSLLLYEEDLTFDISLTKSKSYLICSVLSKDESEIYLIDKNKKNPSLQLLLPRKPQVSYSIKEFDNKTYMLTNENAINNKLDVMTNNGSWEEIVPHSKNHLIVDFLVTDNYYILKTFENSFLKIKYRRKTDSKWEEVKIKTEIFNAEIRTFEGDKIKLSFSSPNQVFTQFEYDLTQGVLTKIETKEIKIGIYPRLYMTERIWAKTKDGVKIPITITKSISPKKKHQGLILKAYGSYGSYPQGTNFSAENAILLDDGFTIAHAHVRGEITLGNQWYLDGKLLNKENSFNDFIACAEHLIKKKYTTKDQLVGYGNSAGGIIMGVVINRRPDLFNTVILDHAYLDVLTTMMDETLPLTTDEYKEWGNPKDKEVYDYIKAYSPYQNIKKQAYPNLLFLASSNDYQTPTWQIAKYVAKLKEFDSGENTVLFKTNFGSGHFGSHSDTEWIKDLSFQYAFIYGNLFD